LSEQQIKNFHKSVNKTVLIPKNGNNPLGVLTSDGRPCITTPTTGPTPGKPGAPSEPNYSGSAQPLIEDSGSSSGGGSGGSSGGGSGSGSNGGGSNGSSNGSNPNATEDKDAKYSTISQKSDSSSKYNGNNSNDQEIKNLEKENPKLANKIENESGNNAGSDKATCLITGDH